MHGSNSPIGSDTNVDDVPFYPYFVSKDVFAFFCFLCFFCIFVFYFPNVLNHPHNCIPANPMKTPLHVVPEWYFLSYYAILRSIPSKTGGILTMGGSIVVLFLIPFINTSYIRNTTYRPIFKFCFWFFITNVIILTWIGQKPVKDIFVFMGKISTLIYFIFFVLIPIVGIIETQLIWYDPVKFVKTKNKTYSTFKAPQ
jgi:ubiquinol-cytochrome c reductase cytochrome b subunit